MKNIGEAALLVQMKLSLWGAQKTDRNLSDQITGDVKGERGAYRVVKQVVPKVFLDPIHSTAHMLRKTFRHYTLPWLYDGTGILPITLHEKFISQYMQYQSEMEQRVEDLVRSMPIVRERARIYSGEGYDPDDIPDDDQIREMFKVKLRFMPVPTENDFRVDMNEDVVEAIKQQYADELQNQIDFGTGHAFMRVVDVLDSMIDALDRYGKQKPGYKKAAYFKDSIIEKVSDLSDILDDLNVAGDERLTEIAYDIRTKLNCVGADDLRSDKELREIISSEAKNIREQAKTGADSVSRFFGV